jgi:hypothetical protein
VTVQISVTPAAAKATLDGTALASNPFAAKFKKDGLAHRLTVQAPGYVRKSELVVFDRDVDLSITLDALGARPGVAAPPPHATPKPGVGIYEGDPWAKKNKPR